MKSATDQLRNHRLFFAKLHKYNSYEQCPKELQESIDNILRYDVCSDVSKVGQSRYGEEYAKELGDKTTTNNSSKGIAGRMEPPPF